MSTERLTLRCALCRATAPAHVHTADFGGAPSAVWLALPPGWVVLLPVIDWQALHARCPEHAPEALREAVARG
jgi:hypothetical protein